MARERGLYCPVFLSVCVVFDGGAWAATALGASAGGFTLALFCGEPELDHAGQPTP